MILASHAFAGSDIARQRFGEILHASQKQIVKELNGLAEELLLKEIESVLTSGAVPRSATLVDDPDVITQIEDKPEKGFINLGYGLGPAPRKFGVNDELGRRRLVSISEFDTLYFEVIQHEGIYFYITGADLRQESAFAGAVGAEVYKATKHWATLMTCIGQLFKGASSVLAAPGQILIDTGKKAIDIV